MKITKEELEILLENVKYSASLGIAAYECNKEAFSELKGCCRGKEIVICGAGPTLSQYKPIQGAVHIALNRALLYEKVHFDYFFADDWIGIKFMQEELIRYDCRKFFGFHFGSGDTVIPETFIERCNGKKYYTDSFAIPNGYRSRFACDIDKLPVANTPNMAMQIMQMAFFMRPDKIYLVGCDASSAGHFTTPKLSEAEIARHDDDMRKCITFEKTKEKWYELKRFWEIHFPDIRIISINPVGLKGLFEDIYTEE